MTSQYREVGIQGSFLQHEVDWMSPDSVSSWIYFIFLISSSGLV
jgi:hypothetical protein